MQRPSQNPVTLPFGSVDPPYSASNRHKGVDFAHSPDPTIYMPEDGTVSLIPNNGNDGNGVYFTAENRMHGLLHTSKYLIGNGTFLKQGSPVAVMGETGLAQGVHLHWALKVNGAFVNGLDYVTQGETMSDTPTSTQVGELFQALAGRQPRQDELDLFVGLNWFDGLKQYLFPGVQTLRDTIKNLEQERDSRLYPYIEAVTGALGLPDSASAQDCVKAINDLKKGGVSSVVINGKDYVPK